MCRICSLLLVLILIGCNQKVTTDDIDYLNGYWEIEKVTFPDGNSKEYTVNATIDYIELDGLKGFRKKVQPKFDGSFSTSNDAEFFVVVEKPETLEIHYKNELSEWSETLIEISENNFSVSNSDGITYNYKRFQPINAKNSDGKTQE